MGLDTSHDAFSGAYSSFNRFRQAICKVIGGSYPPHDDPDLDSQSWYWGDANPGKYPGLEVLLAHSDCDGFIEPMACKRIAYELEALLPKIDALGCGAGHIEQQGGYGAATQRFIAGCRAAADANERLEFW